MPWERYFHSFLVLEKHTRLNRTMLKNRCLDEIAGFAFSFSFLVLTFDDVIFMVFLQKV